MEFSLRDLAFPFGRVLTITDLGLPDRGLCGNGAAQGRARSALVADHRRVAMLRATNDMYDQYPHHLGWVYDPMAYWFPVGRVGVTVYATLDPLWARWRNDETPPLDDDNFWRGCKPYLDGLQDARVVKNDAQLFLAGKIRWTLGTPYAGGVRFVLRAEGDDDHPEGESDAREPAASGHGVEGGEAAGARDRAPGDPQAAGAAGDEDTRPVRRGPALASGSWAYPVH